MRLLACLLIACVTALLASSPANALGYTGSRGPRLGLPGDSITVLAARDLRRDLNGHDRYDIEAFPGDRVSQVDSIITSMLHADRPRPSLWVLNAGTDDAYQDNANWRPGLDQEFRDVAPASCVVMVSINTNADRPPDNGIAQAINETLQYVHDTDPRKYIYLDWNALVHRSPSWLRADGIHPDATGDAEYAAHVSAALGADEKAVAVAQRC
jgi:hypothetical protein